MIRCALLVTTLLTCGFVCGQAQVPKSSAGEYSKHFGALKELTVAVAQAMPVEHWNFRPHPESMSFGMLMSHIATTNYKFCAALKDSAPPQLSSADDRNGIIKLLSDSFDYCSDVIGQLTEGQLAAIHSTPDGKLNGRETLLAMYIHVAHHRGQAEIYLRDNGIKPPGYRI
ncbi:MAG TPA: DinB family protein [Terriglobales bacterium]|nr:DinB family protein [Terriglobales bacterium]